MLSKLVRMFGEDFRVDQVGPREAQVTYLEKDISCAIRLDEISGHWYVEGSFYLYSIFENALSSLAICLLDNRSSVSDERLEDCEKELLDFMQNDVYAYIK